MELVKNGGASFIISCSVYIRISFYNVTYKILEVCARFEWVSNSNNAPRGVAKSKTYRTGDGKYRWQAMFTYSQNQANWTLIISVGSNHLTSFCFSNTSEDTSIYKWTPLKKSKSLDGDCLVFQAEFVAISAFLTEDNEIA